jgi:hypothetical protein
MTLEEAIALARRNNPEFLQRQRHHRGGLGGARRVRLAAAGRVGVHSMGYQAAGRAALRHLHRQRPRPGTARTDYYSSSYQLGCRTG